MLCRLNDEKALILSHFIGYADSGENHIASVNEHSQRLMQTLSVPLREH